MPTAQHAWAAIHMFHIMSNVCLLPFYFFYLLAQRPTVSENFEKWQNAIDESKPVKAPKKHGAMQWRWYLLKLSRATKG